MKVQWNLDIVDSSVSNKLSTISRIPLFQIILKLTLSTENCGLSIYKEEKSHAIAFGVFLSALLMVSLVPYLNTMESGWRGAGDNSSLVFWYVLEFTNHSDIAKAHGDIDILIILNEVNNCSEGRVPTIARTNSAIKKRLNSIGAQTCANPSCFVKF